MRVQNSKTHTIKGFLIGIFFMLGIYAINTYAFTITTDFENAVQYIKRIFVTSNAKPNGTPIVSINTDDKAMIVYGTASFLGNVDIQGTLNATLDELDPIRSAVATNYYTKNEIDANQYTKSEINAKGYLTGETDPIRSAVATNYYTKNEINAKGYITGYTETDPQIGTITTSGKRCTSDGSQINCDEDAPAGSSSTDTYWEEGASSSKIFFNGYIGIGGYSPSERLQIGNWFTLHSNIGHTYISQNFTYTGGAATRLVEGGSAQIALENNGNIVLRTASTGVTGEAITYTEGMRVNSSGYVGINTSNPRTLLQVGNKTIGTTPINEDGRMLVSNGIGIFVDSPTEDYKIQSVISQDTSSFRLQGNIYYSSGYNLFDNSKGGNIISMNTNGINFYHLPIGETSLTPMGMITTTGLQINGGIYVSAGNKVGIGETTTTASAKLTVNGGIRLASFTDGHNPCDEPGYDEEGTMFYSSDKKYFCFCSADNDNAAMKVHDPSDDCWP